MRNLEDFNKDFETWLLSLGFEPYGHEFHMHYTRRKSDYRGSLKREKLLIWLQYNMDKLGIKSIHYRLLNNLKLIVEKVDFSQNKKKYKCPYAITYINEINSPSTIKEITLKNS